MIFEHSKLTIREPGKGVGGILARIGGLRVGLVPAGGLVWRRLQLVDWFSADLGVSSLGLT